MQRHNRTDQFAGRRIVTIGGGSGTFSFLSHLKLVLMMSASTTRMPRAGELGLKLRQLLLLDQIDVLANRSLDGPIHGNSLGQQSP